MSQFEEGNKLWKIRCTHGPDATFTDSNKLWNSAVEYWEWCIDNPMIVTDYRGKDATPVKIKIPPPFTIREFAVFCGRSESWWRNFKRTKTVENDPDMLTVIARIEDVMFTQKFRGAAIGRYKENLISRELGLRDAVDTDHTSKGESITPTIIKWGDKEIRV